MQLEAHVARGTFGVRLVPEGDGNSPKADAVIRLAIDKMFRGDLEALSRGHMLAMSSSAAGSAGYVALEHVSGSLSGRHGSFALQHSGCSNRHDTALTITVVPDSGTGELTDLAGEMTVDIIDGAHHYEFRYVVPELAPKRKPKSPRQKPVAVG